MPKTVIITGASSGLGEQFVFQYAEKGWDLFLLARREELLQKLCEKVAKKFCIKAYYVCCDVRSKEEVDSACLVAQSLFSSVDLVIANAGISRNIDVNSFNSQSIIDLYEVNVFGVLRIFENFIPNMLKNRSGQLVAVSSLAGFCSFPKSHPYCATKAALNSHLEGLYYELKKHNVAVTCLCPGFIDTAMVKKNDFPMPFLMKSDVAVAKMIGAIEKRKKRFVFPKIIYFFIKLLNLVPGFFVSQRR